MNEPHTKMHFSPWLYIAIWIFYVYLFFQIIQFDQSSQVNVLTGGLYFILFGIHEAAHIIMGFLPQVFVASAGSIAEIIFALLLVIVAIKEKAYFASIFALLILMLAMNSAGNYMADAVPQAMQLIGPSPDPQHDWHFVFRELGWLDASGMIGTIVKGLGNLIGLGGLLVGVILIILKFAAKPIDNQT